MGLAHPQGLILASSSPRRVELLTRMGLHFVARPADVEEDNRGAAGPAAMVAANARLKAEAVAHWARHALVLGSDTTVALDGEVLNKPADLEEARAMLRRLSGRCHSVFTGAALVWHAGGYVDCFVECSSVRFKPLDDALISAYFALVDPLDKSGAYGIQQGRDMIIESVDGSVENVMGLPVQALARKLSEQGFVFSVQDG